jgi:acyl carrier protein
MALMQLLILIENNFGLMLSEADLSRQNFTSIRSLAALIRERLLQKSGHAM